MPPIAELLPTLAVAALLALSGGMMATIVAAMRVCGDDGSDDRALAVELALRSLMRASGAARRLRIGVFTVEDVGSGAPQARLYGGREVFPSSDGDARLVTELMRAAADAARALEFDGCDEARTTAVRHCLRAVEGYFNIDVQDGLKAPSLAAA